uniref:Uncharacterized protein n=1 Tax=Rhizophora mucronata TaxID=61149 RepID=A0A2P2P703_RHIMU
MVCFTYMNFYKFMKSIGIIDSHDYDSILMSDTLL